MINKLLPEGSRRRQFVKNLFFEPSVPTHIARNFITLNDSDLNLVKTSLEQNYFSKEPNGYLFTDVGKRDLLDHLTARLGYDRKLTIPWLDSVRHLKDAKVLEIGCGTGASTVALAEQGANVTAIDIDEKALSDAKIRCEIYGLSVEFHHLNATEVVPFFSKETFDFIIFWASLEHMTHEERMIAMKKTWDMMPSRGLWCVTETPNRLYFYDSHTSLMPFF
jgi:2-polyprenyl-3-methyl-5-hydroxy-6-metoxy-1,4-benzoquinol methylase